MANFMKSALAALVMCVTATTATYAGDHHVFNHLGVGVHAATTGFGVEVATPITKFLTLRGGVSIMPGFSFGTDLEGSYVDNTGNDRYFTMRADASFKRTQGNIILNIHPFAHFSSFYIAAGAYFGGSSVLKVTGHSDELTDIAMREDATVAIGDYKLPVDPEGYIHGSLEAKKFRPYLGLGFGRAVPKGRLSFGFELGVQFMGKMKVYSNGNPLDELTDVENEDDWKKVMDKLKVYPVLKFTLSGRIF